jgi:3-deoxy-D-manno-octulosonic-acid transferase
MLFQLTYSLITRLYGLSALILSLFSKKADKFVKGRKNWESTATEIRKQAGTKKLLWFHCASLGEYEQAKPVISGLMSLHTDAFFLLTFYSPSGYVQGAKNPLCHAQMYLPADTQHNAKKFTDILMPNVAIFVKYDFWFNYLRILHEKNIPAIFFSVIFRADHFLMKPAASPIREQVWHSRKIFVQNKASLEQLSKHGYAHGEVAGDTRFDRVLHIARHHDLPEKVRQWATGKNILVCGSIWQNDAKKIQNDLTRILEEDLHAAIIITPHEPSVKWHEDVKKMFPSQQVCAFTNPDVNARIMFVDTVGYLSALYSLGHCAYVGGGFGKGIHNLLEAVVYGIPVMFGPKHKKFAEAELLIQLGAGFVFGHQGELTSMFSEYKPPNENGKKLQITLQHFFEEHAGGSQKVVNFISKNILQP